MYNNKKGAMDRLVLGKEYGYLTLIEKGLWKDVPSQRGRVSMVKVRCRCGEEFLVLPCLLEDGQRVTCKKRSCHKEYNIAQGVPGAKAWSEKRRKAEERRLEGGPETSLRYQAIIDKEHIGPPSSGYTAGCLEGLGQTWHLKNSRREVV